jgi:ABC-type glycerol-3-phosphate transport system substrate-binding protein
MCKKIKKVSLFKILVFLILTSLLLSGCTQQSKQKPSDKSNDISSTFLNIPPVPETSSIPEGTPHGWRANYTEILFNDFESSNPELGLDFSNYAEVTDNAIDGEKSIKIEK